MLQLSNTNWAYVGPRVSQALPPPPFPHLSPCPWSGTPKVPEEGGGVAAGHLPPLALRLNSPTALIHQICQRHCHIWRTTLLLREHPCRSTRARDVLPNNNRAGGWGKKGGGNQGEEVRQVGGGGRRETHVCYAEEGEVSTLCWLPALSLFFWVPQRLIP
jgi:hypothetical protein